MSHFYGVISESARKHAPTARAHHSLTVNAQSWQGQIEVRLTRHQDGIDRFEVWRKPHRNSDNKPWELLSEGRVDREPETKEQAA
jgi:hypothetical protein